MFVIATEGKETEKIYFSVFKGNEYRKNVRVLSTRKGESSPKYVLKRLHENARKESIRQGDELWIVVDVDSWGTQALDALCEECARSGYSVAVSNPCFELWLALHQENPRTPLETKGCEKELERLLGRYDKTEYDVSKLIPHIQLAIEHACRLDCAPDDAWPRETGTRVYRLVAKLIEKND
ncbi:MAG: RloB family protein [Chloroflexales bacterium]|nr:RloB family protein [Chloroflexales bacterium]